MPPSTGCPEQFSGVSFHILFGVNAIFPGMFGRVKCFIGSLDDIQFTYYDQICTESLKCLGAPSTKKTLSGSRSGKTDT